MSIPNLIDLFEINPEIICEYDYKGDKNIKQKLMINLKLYLY